jgi:hypothetical protein
LNPQFCTVQNVQQALQAKTLTHFPPFPFYFY